MDTLLITKRNHVRCVTHKPHRQLTHRCLHFSMKVRRMDEETDVRIDACAIRLVENTSLEKALIPNTHWQFLNTRYTNAMAAAPPKTRNT